MQPGKFHLSGNEFLLVPFPSFLFPILSVHRSFRRELVALFRSSSPIKWQRIRSVKNPSQTNASKCVSAGYLLHLRLHSRLTVPQAFFPPISLIRNAILCWHRMLVQSILDWHTWKHRQKHIFCSSWLKNGKIFCWILNIFGCVDSARRDERDEYSLYAF